MRYGGDTNFCPGGDVPARWKKKLTDLTIDLSGCDREPIHIPGSIQPHGILLVAEKTTLVVRHGAGDVERVFQLERWAGRPLADFLGQEVAGKAALVSETAQKRAFIDTISAPGAPLLDVTAHIIDDYLLVEIEPRVTAPRSSTELLGKIESASNALDQATTLKNLCDIAAVQFRELTRYDRVMVYRFLENGAGAVLAESRRDDLHSFLNHHFPGSDIPQQARALYIRNLLRVIPDVNYEAAPLRPPWVDPFALDMSDSVLRSVSPIHLQYLKNMGVAASASVSIVKDGVLWGLIACHNETPLPIAYDIRATCRTLASNLARQIKTREEAEAYRERLRLRGSQDDTIALLSRHGSLEEEIANHVDDLSRLISCDGFAVLRGKELVLTGACPPEDDVRKLADWLIAKSVESVFSTNRLIASYPPAEQFEGVTAGVLAALLSVEERWLLVWFRAEEVQIVKWAGNPHKAVELKPGEILSPRASFEAWQETVHGHSRRWTMAEIEAAARFRQELLEFRQNRRLRELNRQLTETVAEKDLLLNQKQFLIGEVNHRVQNSLQIVSSFLSFQARESGDAAFGNAVEEARRRITAVSLLHRSLYRGDEIGVTDAGRYIEDLCGNLVASMGGEWKEHFALHLGPVMLPIDRVIPLGLVVTELVINVNKYAYSGEPGPIEITLTEDQGRFRLVVADQGRGRSSSRQGFGTRMMTALVSQLSGQLDFEDNAPGVRVVLSAPVVHQ
jgi:two-component system, chemotaxis family, sensor kinase Cph1